MKYSGIICLGLILLITLSACDFEVPRKVQVKADPSFEMAVGSRTILVDEYFSIEKMIEMMSLDSQDGMEIVTYDPEQNGNLRFLMRYPVTSVDLDFNQYLQNMDFTTNLSSSIPTISQTIPTINQTASAINLPISLDSDQIAALGFVSSMEINIPINTTIDGVSSETLSNAIINDGSLKLSIEKPEEIIVSINYLNLQQNDIIIKTIGSQTADEQGNFTIPLDNVSINPNSITISGQLQVRIPGGISLDSISSIRLTPTLSVSSFKSVTIPIDINLNKTINVPVTDDMKEWIKSISFLDNTVGIDLQLNNQLPNNITIGLVCPSLKINTTNTFNAHEDTTKQYRNTGTVNLIPGTLDPSQISFVLTTTMDGYDSDTKQLTLANVQCGSTISLSGTPTVKFEDWNSVTVKPAADTGFSGTFPEAGSDPLDLSDITELLGDGLGIGDVPVYLYLNGPSSFSVKGKISASYKDSTGVDKSSYWLGTETDSTDIQMTGNLPTKLLGVDQSILTKKIPKSLTVTDLSENDITTINNEIEAGTSFPRPSADLHGFTDLINGKYSNIRLQYSLTMNEITINKNDISSNTKISADLLIDFPVVLKVTNPDGAELALPSSFGLNSEKDLFERKVGDSNQDINRLIDSLDTVALKLNVKNNMGLAVKLKLYQETDKGVFNKDFSVGVDESNPTLSIESNDLSFIKKQIPFSPKVSLVIPYTENGYAIKRDGSLGVVVSGKIGIKLDQEFDLGGN